MKKLKTELNQKFKEKLQILTPRNCQLVKLKLVSKKNAKILGQLAREVMLETNILRNQIQAQGIPKQVKPNDDQIMENEEDDDLQNYMEVEVSGIFIKHDFDHIILNEDEVEKYTNGNLTYSTMK